MSAPRIMGWPGAAQLRLRGHREMIMPIPCRRSILPRADERCGECPACLSDMADIVPCMRRPS